MKRKTTVPKNDDRETVDKITYTWLRKTLLERIANHLQQLGANGFEQSVLKPKVNIRDIFKVKNYLTLKSKKYLA